MIRAGILALGLLLVACTASAQDEPGATEPGQVPPDTPAPTGMSPAGPLLAPGFGDPVAVTPGAVTVLVDRDAFRPGEPITGTVANGLEAAIYVEDMQSDCTIVTLERWDGVMWQPLGSCSMERLPQVAAIGPERGRGFTIHPTSLHFAGDPAGEGTYRLVVQYRFTAELSSDAPTSAASEPFAIHR